MVNETQSAKPATSDAFAGMRRHGAIYALGALLLAGGLGLHWWFTLGQERQATTPLEEMAARVQSIRAKRINPLHEGKLVFVVSDLRTQRPFGDRDILKPASYLKIKRTVEVYQSSAPAPAATGKKKKGRWQPGKHQARRGGVGDKGRWVPVIARRGNDFGNAELTSPHAQFGAFDGQFLLKKTMPFKALSLKAQNLANPRYSTDGTWVYLGRTRQNPRAGDKRVRYEVVRAPEVFSVVGVQEGQRLVPYEPKSPGSPQLLVARGRVSLNALLPGAGKQETGFSWWSQLLAFALVAMSMLVLLFPSREILAFLPLPDRLKQGAFVAVSLIAAVAISGIFLMSMMIIQTPWLFIGLMAAAGAFAYHSHRRREEARMKRARSSMVDIPPETRTNIERVG